MVVDISPISVSPGAQSMTEFLSVMEQIKLGEDLKRTTARKIVDEQLQLVVKVTDFYVYYYNLNFKNYSLFFDCLG